MAEMEAKIAALLFLLAAILLLHTLLLQPPLLRGLVPDPLLSTTLDLRFDGRRLVGLVNRRNMILLCHAILLVVLKDAGLLTAPARPRRHSSATTAASAAADGDCCSQAQPQSESGVAWRNSRNAGASDAKSANNAADGGRLKRDRRRSESATATARVRRGLPLTGAVHLVEKYSSSDCFNFDHAAGKEITVVEDKGSCFQFEQIADDERSRGEEEMAQQETEAEIVDKMNKRFEEFIANMRRKMQMESLQLVKV